MYPRRSKCRWRFLVAPPRSGAENMARDVALQSRAARTREAVFSIYSWARPTLSFGRNQPARGLYDLGKIEGGGIDVVRRPTGGRAILHHHEVTYSVTAPIDGADLGETYAEINQILQLGLSRLGVLVEASAGSERSEVPSVRPCFETPARGELVAGGAKLVGSAQWREDGALLQHGSILVDDDQSALLHLSVIPIEIHRWSPPASLHSLLGRTPDAQEVAAAMLDAVRSLEDEEVTELDEAEIRAQALARVPQFLDEGWTWRR
jgi:lipoyl(octanoyl) transferase